MSSNKFSVPFLSFLLDPYNATVSTLDVITEISETVPFLFFLFSCRDFHFCVPAH